MEAALKDLMALCIGQNKDNRTLSHVITLKMVLTKLSDNPIRRKGITNRTQGLQLTPRAGLGKQYNKIKSPGSNRITQIQTKCAHMH